MTEQQVRQVVLPALCEVSLTDTGLANSSCSRIVRGLMTPHLRHWEVLLMLTASRQGVRRGYRGSSRFEVRAWR